MNAIKSKLSTFGRQAFDLYDKYPLLCNSVVGSTVYAAGELVVQHNNLVAAGPSVALVSNPTASISPSSSFSSSVIDYRRIGQIGLLGGLENGVFMLIWYSTLNFIVGASKATSTVLIKCALDQVFFAAQQDGVFLALCAYQHKEGLQDAMREVKKTFLTTWLNDCSVWPLVNFLGFAAVPVKIQPTFMSSAQFFWQVYVSSVAAASSEEGKLGSEADARLAKAFNDIDTDGSGYIDATELKTALNRRGVKDLSSQEVEKMIAEVAKFRVVQPQPQPQQQQNKNLNKEGQVSLEDFKAITKLVRDILLISQAFHCPLTFTNHSTHNVITHRDPSSSMGICGSVFRPRQICKRA